MGNKLKLNQLHHQGTSALAVRTPKQQVCMSLTTDVAVESRVSSLIKLYIYICLYKLVFQLLNAFGYRTTQLRDLEMEKRDPRTVVAVILGGGAGTRLFPLTKRRAKPAVSFSLYHIFHRRRLHVC